VIGGGIWLWDRISISGPTGTLTVRVEAAHVGTPYYWVYLKAEGQPQRLIAARGPSSSDPSWSQPISLKVAPGNYKFELYRSHPSIGANSTCAVEGLPWYPIASVTVGKQTNVAFGLNAQNESEWGRTTGACRDQAYMVPAGMLAEAVRIKFNECERWATPLFKLMQQFELSPPNSPRIMLTDNLGFGYALGAAEYDSRQIRHAIMALNNTCWEWFKVYQRSADARTLALVMPIVEESRLSISRLNDIADKMDRTK